MITKIKVGDEIVIKGRVTQVDNSHFPLCVEFTDFTEWVALRLITEVNGGDPHDEARDYEEGDEVHICANVINVDVSDERLPFKVKLGENSDVLEESERWIAYDDIVSVNGVEFNHEA